MSGPNWRCIGPWPLCGHPRNTCTASPAYQAAIKAKHASSMTTPDIAGLCKKLRRAGLKSSVEVADTLERQAADALERQAAEIERLRDKVEGLESDLRCAVQVAYNRGATEWARLNYPDMIEWLESCAEARAALTGED
jgi:hypothetical protein